MLVYAAPDGVPANDGSECAPWPLQHAIDQLDETVDPVLVLLAGVYDDVPITISNQGCSWPEDRSRCRHSSDQERGATPIAFLIKMAQAPDRRQII